MKIDFVLNAKTKLSFSRLRQQRYVISGLAQGTNFKNYEVAFCLLADLPAKHWDVIASFACCVCPQNLNFVKTMNVNIKSKFGNCNSKIYLPHVKEVN